MSNPSSLPLKCKHCDGLGFVVVKVYGLRYPNGWRTEARDCTHCNHGVVPVMDSKTAAVGERVA